VRLADGTPALLASLAPELARDEVLRRRYRRDVARVQALAAPCVAEVLATGPDPRRPRHPALAPAPRPARRDARGLADPPRPRPARRGRRRRDRPRRLPARRPRPRRRAARPPPAPGRPRRRPHVAHRHRPRPRRRAVDPHRREPAARGLAVRRRPSSSSAPPSTRAPTSTRSASCSTWRSPASCRAATARPCSPTSRSSRPSAVRSEVPPALDRVILRCLARDPADRPSSADELARCSAATPSPTSTPRARPLPELRRRAPPRPAPVPRVRPAGRAIRPRRRRHPQPAADQRQGGQRLPGPPARPPRPAQRRPRSPRSTSSSATPACTRRPSASADTRSRFACSTASRPPPPRPCASA
jgi:serine/threonine protein kinase